MSAPITIILTLFIPAADEGNDPAVLRFLASVGARARLNVADHAWAVARVMGVAS